MKKRRILIIIIIIFIILLIKPMKELYLSLTIPDKTLILGRRVDCEGVEFFKEINDKKIITEFEDLFKELKFEDKWDNKDYKSDYVVHIRHNKEGIFTHWFDIYFIEDYALVVKSMIDEPVVDKLNEKQADILKNILE